ncbi:hypothetical protein [Anaerobranca gottschalkii]|uniref:DUF2508 domain-containing protein n=1 Tax=Anaerobranca gottschalkii DSM 13577 TaxID=1120990 RepID=A0A1H9ZU81_9FIRM|nr:hypothetical protein [Anaerobranca gottschalkii]SES85314.1 hypothetical protein SAMN03080614_101327 [Anaerobranca gottschalkii DSM 13577]
MKEILELSKQLQEAIKRRDQYELQANLVDKELFDAIYSKYLAEVEYINYIIKQAKALYDREDFHILRKKKNGRKIK